MLSCGSCGQRTSGAVAVFDRRGHQRSTALGRSPARSVRRRPDRFAACSAVFRGRSICRSSSSSSARTCAAARLDERLTSGRRSAGRSMPHGAAGGAWTGADARSRARPWRHATARSLLLEAVANQPANVKLLFDAGKRRGRLIWPITEPAGDWRRWPIIWRRSWRRRGRLPDPLTDIYALGCTLYALLAGQPPFAGGSLQQKLARHATEPIRPLESMGVPQPIAQLVAYLMAKNPAVRYQSAALVGRAAGDALSSRRCLRHCAGRRRRPWRLMSKYRQAESRRQTCQPATRPAAAVPLFRPAVSVRGRRRRALPSRAVARERRCQPLPLRWPSMFATEGPAAAAAADEISASPPAAAEEKSDYWLWQLAR